MPQEDLPIVATPAPVRRHRPAPVHARGRVIRLAVGLASLAWRRNPLDILRESVALAVAAIPEGLPVSTTAAICAAWKRTPATVARFISLAPCRAVT